MHCYSTRRSKRKQSLSDKLDIGAGKYVHNLEFPSSPQNTKIKAVGSSDGSSKQVNLSWSDTIPNKRGQYVTMFNFHQIWLMVTYHQLMI